MYKIIIKSKKRVFKVKHIRSTVKIIAKNKRGLPGVGIPKGGTTGQHYAKKSNADYDGEWVNAGSGSVSSVNGQTGAVVLDPDDLDDTSTTNKFATASELSDIASNTSARHTHSNKALLDTYTQTETDLADAVAKKHTAVDISGKQDVLVSGTNIKTINSTSLLGSGDIVVGGAVDSVNSQTGVVVLDQDDIGDGTTYKQYSATEKTKLAGIETGADVTDTANVTSAGAVMTTGTNAMSGVYNVTNAGTANALKVDQNGNTSASTSVGGAVLIENTGNTGAGLVVYSAQGSSAGHLISSRVNNAAFAHSALYLDYNGTGSALNVVNTGTGTSNTGIGVNSTNESASALNIIGKETSRGTVKIRHDGKADGSDTGASALALELATTGTASQGLFLDAPSGTTGKLLNLRNSSSDRFVVDASGNVTLAGTVDGVDIAAEQTRLANTSGTNTGDQDLSGYELLSNKDTTTTLGTSDTKYPSQKAVKTYVDTTAGAYVPLAGGTMTGTLTGRQVAPSTDSTYTLGTSSAYWSNTYTDRLYLNSTAYLDGGTAGQINHTGSFGSTNLYNGASLTLYNTTDQTTNYERVRQYWSGNVFNITGEQGGTGTVRMLQLSVGNSFQLRLNSSATLGMVSITGTSGVASGIGFLVNPTLTATSTTQSAQQIAPTINQSGTASYTALLINPTETATGSGTKNLIDAQVGGTSKFKVANTGDAEITTSSAGVILKDSSGGRWRVTVDTSGALVTTSI